MSVEFTLVILLCVHLTWSAAPRAASNSDSQTGYFLETQPQLAITSGKAITRNTRRIANLSAVSDFSLTPASIHITWNTTPAVTESCCAFTVLSVYPTDSTGLPWSPEDATLVSVLQPNVTEHFLNLNEVRQNGQSSSGSRSPNTAQDPKFVICIQIWFRNRGVERKLDENCVAVTALPAKPAWYLSARVLIIFSVVIGINMALLVVLLYVCLRRGGNRSLPFTMKEWWKDMSDVLHQHESRTEVLEETVHGVVNGGLSVVSSGPLNNAVYQQNLSGRYQYPVAANGQLMRPTIENVYYGVQECPSQQKMDVPDDQTSEADSGTSSDHHVQTVPTLDEPVQPRSSLFTKNQLAYLEREFSFTKFPSDYSIQSVAAETNLGVAEVKEWFSSRLRIEQQKHWRAPEDISHIRGNSAAARLPGSDPLPHGALSLYSTPHGSLYDPSASYRLQTRNAFMQQFPAPSYSSYEASVAYPLQTSTRQGDGAFQCEYPTAACSSSTFEMHCTCKQNDCRESFTHASIQRPHLEMPASSVGQPGLNGVSLPVHPATTTGALYAYY